MSIRAANKHEPQTLASFQGENKGLPETQLGQKLHNTARTAT